MSKLYPESHVELEGYIARHYEHILNLITFGKYKKFIRSAIERMEISPEDKILDLGAGAGYNAEVMARYIDDRGKIVGLDISEDGIDQFRKKFSQVSNVTIENRRIDLPLDYESAFDKVFISFVIHGLPHTAREEVIKNAYRSLKSDGRFYVLDYGEFDLSDLPAYLRLAFKVGECKYAYDYIDRNWPEILDDFGFTVEDSFTYFGDFARLLVAKKRT